MSLFVELFTFWLKDQLAQDKFFEFQAHQRLVLKAHKMPILSQIGIVVAH